MAADARVSLNQELDATPDLPSKWRKMIDEAFDSARSREISIAITCKCCGEERKYLVNVPVTDWAARGKVLDLLLTQAKGKPAETKTIDLNVFAAKTRAELSEMSDEQLAILAGGETPKPKD